jgi:hypothetical protein
MGGFSMTGINGQHLVAPYPFSDRRSNAYNASGKPLAVIDFAFEGRLR